MFITKKVRLSFNNLKGVCQSSSGLMVKSLLAMASIGFCINRTHFDRKLQRLRVRFREIRSVSRNRKTVPVSSNRQTSRKNGLFRCNRYSRLEHPFFLLFFVKINHIIINSNYILIFLHSYSYFFELHLLPQVSSSRLLIPLLLKVKQLIIALNLKLLFTILSFN